MRERVEAHALLAGRGLGAAAPRRPRPRKTSLDAVRGIVFAVDVRARRVNRLVSARPVDSRWGGKVDVEILEFLSALAHVLASSGYAALALEALPVGGCCSPASSRRSYHRFSRI